MDTGLREVYASRTTTRRTFGISEPTVVAAVVADIARVETEKMISDLQVRAMELPLTAVEITISIGKLKT